MSVMFIPLSKITTEGPCNGRFAKERPLETGALSEAAPLPLDAGPFAGTQPSLGQLCFGASQARGVQAHTHCRAPNLQPARCAATAGLGFVDNNGHACHSLVHALCRSAVACRASCK